jgi:hypothetical protein
VLVGAFAWTSAAQEPCNDTGKTIDVSFSHQRWPNFTEHISDVRQRYEKVFHIDRLDARANRYASTKDTPTAEGMDRDEYPPAMSAEGGAGADVRLIPMSENRSSGSYMGAALGSYCNGVHFRMVVVP